MVLILWLGQSGVRFFVFLCCCCCCCCSFLLLLMFLFLFFFVCWKLFNWHVVCFVFLCFCVFVFLCFCVFSFHKKNRGKIKRIQRFSSSTTIKTSCRASHLWSSFGTFMVYWSPSTTSCSIKSRQYRKPRQGKIFFCFLFILVFCGADSHTILQCCCSSSSFSSFSFSSPFPFLSLSLPIFSFFQRLVKIWED